MAASTTTSTALARSCKLRSGAMMPQIGFGTWGIKGPNVEAAVTCALDSGYRHLDLAFIYENQKEVGVALECWLKRNPNVKRKDIFITSKLWLTDFRPERVADALRSTLKDLRLEYLDLYLMHWPLPMEPCPDPFNTPGKRDSRAPKLVDTWRELEKLCDAGLTKHIGISNFNVKTMEKFMYGEAGSAGGAAPQVRILPAVNQIELHPLLPQHELLKYCAQQGIVVTAYSPLGSTDSPLLSDTQILGLAKKYDATAAQVLISWAVQRNTVVIPKSSNKERIASNAAKIITFNPQEMALLDNMHASPSHNQTRFIDPVKFWGIDLCSDNVVCE